VLLKKKLLTQEALKQGQLFFKHVVPAAVKPMHSLWHEVIGFVFIVFAVIAGFSGYRTFLKFNGDPGDMVRMGLCAIFAVIMGAYGVSSFLKARKISRS
jgi:hypothetical protein